MGKKNLDDRNPYVIIEKKPYHKPRLRRKQVARVSVEGDEDKPG